MISEYITDMKEARNGFEFGDPWRFSNRHIACVLPIIRNANGDALTYRPYQNGANARVEDTGSIDKLNFFNDGDEPLFVRMGEMFTGFTQERSLIMSRVIRPHFREEIPVVCVHASKGINQGTNMISGGYAPDKDALFSTQNYSFGRVKQDSSWNHDRAYVTRAKRLIVNDDALQLSSPANIKNRRSDDVHGAQTDLKEYANQLVRRVPSLDHQIGMAILDSEGLYSIECFNLPFPWKMLEQSIIEKDIVTLHKYDNKNAYEYVADEAGNAFRDALPNSIGEKELYSNEQTKTISLDSQRFSGEAVIFLGVLIHILLTRKEQTNEPRRYRHRRSY